MEDNSVINKFQKKINVGDKEYVIRVLPAGVGMKMGLRLVKIVTPLLGGVMDDLSSNSDLFGEDDTFTKLASKMVLVLEEEQLDEIVHSVLSSAVIIEKGKIPRDLDFDNDFMANYGELIEVLAFALKENFSSIFQGKGIRHHLAGMVTKVLG